MVEMRDVACRSRMAFLRALLTVVLALAFLAAGARVRAESALYDNAGLFRAGEREQLEELAEELAEEYGQNIILLTADDAFGMSSAQLAEELYEAQGYDENGEKGGIVLLIDMDNRELNLVTSGDMIRYITDAREERIYDAGYAYASDGDYADAMYAMLEQVGEYLETGIPRNQYSYDTETGRISRYRSLTSLDWLLALTGGLLAGGLTCFGIIRSYRNVKEYEYSPGQNADIRLTGRRDRLVNQFVTQRIIPRNPPPGNSGGGGSFDGRSSTHTSSGGGTYGGGHGRRF